jgi:DNA polymerase/3'-5' exonuclease PolX
MEHKKALEIAEATLERLRPHCHRCEIAGSIRRMKPEVKDIEIVAIPKSFEVGLLESGIASVVNTWECVKGHLLPFNGKGELPCKYTQRILPEGIKLDLFFANKLNWGYIYAIRTGSSDFSRKVLATGWVKQGYKGIGGHLTLDGKIVPVPEESDLFRILGIPYANPQHRL